MNQPLPPTRAPNPLTLGYLKDIGAAFNSRDVERMCIGISNHLFSDARRCRRPEKKSSADSV